MATHQAVSVFKASRESTETQAGAPSENPGGSSLSTTAPRPAANQANHWAFGWLYSSNCVRCVPTEPRVRHPRRTTRPAGEERLFSSLTLPWPQRPGRRRRWHHKTHARGGCVCPVPPWSGPWRVRGRSGVGYCGGLAVTPSAERMPRPPWSFAPACAHPPPLRAGVSGGSRGSGSVRAGFRRPARVRVRGRVSCAWDAPSVEGRRRLDIARATALSLRQWSCMRALPLGLALRGATVRTAMPRGRTFTAAVKVRPSRSCGSFVRGGGAEEREPMS